MSNDQTKPTGINFWVQAIVSNRDGEPYVQLANTDRMIGQFTTAEARNIALDLIHMASNAEADAMIIRFFRKLDLPEGALGALLIDFRDFRHEQDMKKVERSRRDPDTGEKIG